MSIHSEDLKLLTYIQEQKSLSLNQLSAYFKKERSSIRKELKHMSEELPPDSAPLVYNNQVTTSMDYPAYLNFIQNLSISEYSPSILERISVILLICYEKGDVNLSRLYNSWNFSSTTKKKDTKYLRELLKPYDLEIFILRKKGIMIKGNEFLFRLLISQFLFTIVEVTETLDFYERLANNPFEHLLYIHFSNIFHNIEQKPAELYDKILENLGITPSYPSKKMLLIYIILLYHHYGKLDILPEHFTDMPSSRFDFVKDTLENEGINRLLLMLDFRPAFKLPDSRRLADSVNSYFKLLCRELNLNFYTHSQVNQELYTYIYKKMAVQHYHIELTDKLVKNTEQHETEIYACIAKYASYFQEDWQFQMNSDHISAITLILKKWKLKNKIIGREKLRFILVTNTIEEKLEYFIESLKEFIDFKIIAVLDINELYLIKELPYQYIITLSDRTSLVLKQLGYSYIRLHFFLTDEDIRTLKDLGFPSKASRFIARNFIGQIFSLPSEETAEEYLLEYYDDYFI